MHDIYRKSIKTLAEENTMIRYQSQHQLPIEELQTPFELRLSRENRWVRLAGALPWDALVQIYCRALSKKHGRPAKNPRIVIGALIIKHKEVLSDERTIETIQETVYQQYFLGLAQYQYEPVFDPSLFVTIRKRIRVEAFDAMVQELMWVVNDPSKASLSKRNTFHEEQTNTSSSPGSQEQNASSHTTALNESSIYDSTNRRFVERPYGSVDPWGVFEKEAHLPLAETSSSDVSSAASSSDVSETNAGTLIIDMTVAPADIAYPTDMELLNTSREKTEELIDILYNNFLETLA